LIVRMARIAVKSRSRTGLETEIRYCGLNVSSPRFA